MYLIFVLFVSNAKIDRVENKEASCQCVFNCPKVLFVVVHAVVVVVYVVVLVLVLVLVVDVVVVVVVLVFVDIISVT